MCVFFGAAFLCYNSAMSEEQRRHDGSLDCRGARLEPQVRLRDRELVGPAPVEYYGIVCSCAAELVDVAPQELFFGYCDACANHDSMMTWGDVEMWTVKNLRNGRVFYQQSGRSPDGGYALLSREEALGDDGQGWRRVAWEGWLREYLQMWNQERGDE